MVDSVAVLPPGWRAFDNNGNLLTDAILAFFDAGTSNARTVYSDANLSVSLGTTVNCNSAGYPVSSGNAKTLIYTGSTAYKIRLTSVLFGGTVFEHDNVRGALDTSTFLTSAAVADRNIVNVSTDRAVTIADKGSLLNVNCSAAAIALTFDDASDCEGLWVGIRHDGTANQVKITGDGTDTFGLPGVNATAFSLTGRGQTVWISCDGASFKVESEAQPLIMGNTGVIAIADRLATPPGSPTPGARYIVTSSPTGAWSSFAEHDIAEANGFGGWFRYTPASDCGWIAYVQDEDVNYQFRGSAWVSKVPTVQRFTSGTGATYTPAAGVSYIRVRMVGGGGGGGARATNAGGNGGTTSFGSWTAIGGTGGQPQGDNTSGGGGGSGGADGTGTLVARLSGADGQRSANFNPTTGSSGGSSVFGGAGALRDRTTGGSAKANTGSGGAGGGQTDATFGGGGGAGEYVEFFVTSPSATTYSVGTAGSAGAAGTTAGGSGAAGIIIVEEYY
jgi:hypothetical protein